MCFNLPFFQTGSKPVDDALYQLVEKLNATEFGAYAVFKEAENAINAEKIPNTGASDTAKSQLAGYAALRDLIIKTGDYAIAHNESITKTLSGSYVTISDFGTYREQMDNRITADESGITQLYSYSAELDTRATALEGETETLDGRATALEGDTEGINNGRGDYGVTTKQYVKTGLLFYDGAVPKYGVGIGIIETNQTQGGEVIDRDTSKLLTMTADEIAFWQQAVKVAYIQSGAINFPNANITGGSIKIGGTAANPNFEVDSTGAVIVNAKGTNGGMKIDSNTQGILFMDTADNITAQVSPLGIGSSYFSASRNLADFDAMRTYITPGSISLQKNRRDLVQLTASSTERESNIYFGTDAAGGLKLFAYYLWDDDWVEINANKVNYDEVTAYISSEGRYRNLRFVPRTISGVKYYLFEEF